MNLKKKSETATRITFEIVDVPEGTEAFAFYADGKRVSKTCKAGQREVTFSKGAAAYTVTAVSFQPITSAAYPATQPPPPPPPPPPPTALLAPMTHYKTDRADARYCVHSPGVIDIGGGKYRDEGGFTYSENGLCDGGRTGRFVAVLKGADSMDGLEPCDGYEKDGRRFPPWPAESYDL